MVMEAWVARVVVGQSYTVRVKPSVFELRPCTANLMVCNSARICRGSLRAQFPTRSLLLLRKATVLHLCGVTINISPSNPRRVSRTDQVCRNARHGKWPRMRDVITLWPCKGC